MSIQSMFIYHYRIKLFPTYFVQTSLWHQTHKVKGRSMYIREDEAPWLHALTRLQKAWCCDACPRKSPKSSRVRKPSRSQRKAEYHSMALSGSCRSEI